MERHVKTEEREMIEVLNGIIIMLRMLARFESDDMRREFVEEIIRNVERAISEVVEPRSHVVYVAYMRLNGDIQNKIQVVRCIRTIVGTHQNGIKNIVEWLDTCRENKGRWMSADVPIKLSVADAETLRLRLLEESSCFDIKLG
jgi:hypothetical protein